MNEKKNKNIDFIQFNRKNMNAIENMIEENPIAAKVFMFLTRNMEKDNAVACSQKTLQEEIKKSRMSIYKAIKYLEENEYLEVYKMGTANFYVMNPELVWRDKFDNRKFCKFQGSILISKSENLDKLERKRRKVQKARVKMLKAASE